MLYQVLYVQSMCNYRTLARHYVKGNFWIRAKQRNLAFTVFGEMSELLTYKASYYLNMVLHENHCTYILPRSSKMLSMLGEISITQLAFLASLSFSPVLGHYCSFDLIRCQFRGDPVHRQTRRDMFEISVELDCITTGLLPAKTSRSTLRPNVPA